MRRALIVLLAAFFCYSFQISAQKSKKVVISGNVTDIEGKPVAGANIFIDKIKTDVITRNDGSYSVKVKSDAKDILVFSLIKGAKEESINGRTHIDFVLTLKTAGETDIRKNAGIEKSLNFKDSAVPVYTDIYDMIKGRVPGVEVSGKSIKIRGTNSLNISTEPLFVVDGVITGDIDDISPETVKSIEVLKGPDASVYGTRGSNGVIVITRLTGKD